MKIQIKTGEKNISIPVPTSLLFSKVSVWLYTKFIRKANADAMKHAWDQDEQVLFQIPDDAMYVICDELKRVKKKHGAWTLVEVHSAQGEEVTITL